ncbi:MAG: inositol monophosphatase [Sphingomonadaceae bacterium]|nr:inositol monophosphatase [Sphingomonadaceae bacterium]
MKHPLDGPVAALLHKTAAEIVLPRFRALAAYEIEEKSPGEIVTIADTESEKRLSEGLAELLPDALIVGEEAAEDDPALMDSVGDGEVWLIDPIDGTTNFSEGKTPFALMIALLGDGEPLASWMFDPVTGRLCHAYRGEGAYVGDEAVITRPTGAAPPIAAFGMHFMTDEKRRMIEERAAGKLDAVPIPRCAGEQYPRLALGVNDISLFERTLPWDHAPGALFLDEAGGKTARPDGEPYRPADRRPGLLSAATPRLWDYAAEILFGQ